MDEAIDAIIYKTCVFGELYPLVLEDMKQINTVIATQSESVNVLNFLLSNVAMLLEKESHFGTALWSIVHSAITNKTLSRDKLNSVFNESFSKKTLDDLKKIALEHYDNKNNWIYSDPKDDAIMKCILLKFRVEMIANVAIHFNFGGDLDLLKKLHSDSDHFRALKSITNVSNIYASKFCDIHS